mgnify:CR=1 FL=1
MSWERVKQMLHLARRARVIIGGDRAVRLAIRKRRAKFILIAEDAAERTKRNILFYARRAGVPAVVYGRKEELGLVQNRSSCAVIAVMDENFARGIMQYLTAGREDIM